MTWLTWRIGTFLLAGVLAFVGGVALYDNVRNRIRIEMLTGDRDALAKTLAAVNQNLGACHANVEKLSAGFDIMVKGVVDLEKATKASADQAKADMARLVTQGKGVAAEVSRIGKLPPPMPQSACTDSERVLRGQL